ncbi:MAG TPA: hypothetical protein ENH82_09805 [bacterium]|nr:hypothetical protein [bacterium]
MSGVLKGASNLSNVIKKSVKTDDVVSVGNSPYSFSVLEKEKSINRFKHTLDFKGGIDSAIDGWQKKIEDEVSSIEESTEKKIEEAYQGGYDKGFNDGKEKEYADREDYLNEHFSDRFKVVEKLVGEARKKNEKAFQGLEDNIIHLAINIAETIVHKNIETDPSIIIEIVTEAMSRLISSETIILKVSENDYQVIKEKYDKWLGMAGNVKEFNIEIDKRLISGDCFIETEGGIIDASISSRLDILAEELLKANK